jgi:hypothetical protein
MIKEKQPKEMSDPEWAEYVYEKQSYIMAGIRASVEIIDGHLQRPGCQHSDMLLEKRQTFKQHMADYSRSNEELLEVIYSGPIKKPLLAFKHTYVDDAGNVHEIIVKPCRRERLYNILNKLFRWLLLNGQ